MQSKRDFKAELFPSKESLMKNHNFPSINIVSNHYPLILAQDQNITEWFIKIINKDEIKQYHIDPEQIKDALPLDSRDLREEIFLNNKRQISKLIGECYTSGNNLFSSRSYKNNLVFEEDKKFAFVLEFVKNINFEDLKKNINYRAPVLRIINSCFKSILKAKNFTEWGMNKQYYNDKIFEKIPEYNMTVYKGSTFKADLLEKGIYITVGPTNRIIQNQNLYQAFLDQKIPSDDKNRIIDFFEGKSVLCTYNRKIIVLSGVDFSKSLTSAFPNPKFKNYIEYYEKNYNCKLEHKNQFLVTRIRHFNKVGKNGEPFKEEFIEHFPPELLKPTGMSDAMRSDWRVMKRLGDITIDVPEQKFKNIANSLKLLEDNSKSSGLNFKIEISKNKITGYNLPRPKLEGKNQIKGDRIFLNELADNKSIEKWIFIYDYRLAADHIHCINNILKASKKYKINVKEPLKVFQMPKNCTPGNLWQLMTESKVTNATMIFFFVTPFTGKHIYKNMKIFFTGKKGILSQFFTSYNPKKDQGNLSKFGNLVLQMSVKLGASPWKIDLPIKNAAIFGADVYHDRKNKSVAALVSIFGNNYFGRYSTQKIQKKGQEIMKNMSEMMMEHLDYIVRSTKKLPENILFYRDGVGEGQVPIIVKEELTLIINTLYEKYQAKAPKITLIIVTKRIDDRFAVVNNNRLDNPEGGLIAMDSITRPDKANFFMISQKVNQGTARPTHYEVVINQSGFNLPLIQNVTYLLTHMYFNWMGAVKVPAVVQYAHTCTNLIGIMQNDNIKESIKSLFHYL